MLASFERAWRTVLVAFSYIGTIGLIILSVMVTVDVTVRWFTGRPFVGVFELSEILLVLVTFSAVGLVHMDNRQLSVDILSAKARGRTAAGLHLFDAVIGLLVFSLLLWKSWEEFTKALAGNFLRRGMIEIPTAVPVGFIVAGSFCIVVSLIIIIRRSIAQLAGCEEPSPPAQPHGGQ
ncbi:MAG: TRAP transporter small permease subunit [Alphaproteobacteria bacterium]